MCGSKPKQASQYLEVYPPPPSLWVSSVDEIKGRENSGEKTIQMLAHNTIVLQYLLKCNYQGSLMIRGGLELVNLH